MLIKSLSSHNEYLITVDIEQLARNANVTPELLKALLSSPREFSVAPSVFGSMYAIDQLPPGSPAPRPPVHALTHQVMGLPRLDVSGEICQIKIQIMPHTENVYDIAHTLIPMLHHLMTNELYVPADPTIQAVDLRQWTVLVPRVVNVNNRAGDPNYAWSFDRPVALTEELGWEIHGWDFVYTSPCGVTNGEMDITDQTSGTLTLHLDHDDPDPAGTLATIINTYFNTSANQTESKYVKFYDYLEKLELMISNVRARLAYESPELSPAYIDELLREVRSHAVFSWIKETANNL